jgi:hypothetical protein
MDAVGEADAAFCCAVAAVEDAPLENRQAAMARMSKIIDRVVGCIAPFTFPVA